MADDNLNTPPAVSPAKTASCENKSKKKKTVDYASQRERFENSFKGNEFLTIQEALEAVNTRIV